MSCNYYKEYVSNLNYISKGLLEIITDIILSGDSSYSAVKKDDNCITPTQLPTDIFDCNEYMTIRNLLTVASSGGGLTPVTAPGYLTILCDTLACIPEKVSTLDYGLKSQFERFECLCNSLKIRLESVCCNSNCPDVIGDLLCLLFEIISALIAAITKAASIVYYSDCAAGGDKVSESFYNCIVCDFVNDLCELDRLIPELSSIVVAFATCDSKVCTPCYTAPYAPRRVRPLCPPNAMYGNSRPNYGNGSGGCGCKTCK